MGQLRSRFPARKLDAGSGRIRRNEFDDGSLRLPSAAFRQENRAVGGAAQILAEQEGAIHSLALPLFPVPDHSGPRLSAGLHARYCKRASRLCGPGRQTKM